MLRVAAPAGLEPGARALIARLLAGERGGLSHAAIGTGTRAAGAPGLGLEVARVPLEARYDEHTRTVVARSHYEYAQGAGEIRESALFGGDLLVAYQAHDPIDRTRPRVLSQRFELSLTTEAPITVPAVEGTPLAAARDTIEAAGLAIAVQERPAPRATRQRGGRGTAAGPLGAAAATGPVVAQTSAGGATARAGHVVTLTVEVPARVVVPNLLGSTPAGAAVALAAAGLTLAPGAPAGTVIRSSPPAGAQVAAGSEVAVVVADPREAVVPDVRGQSTSVASAMLSAVGLALAAGPHATEESSTTAGTILAQQPAGGARVAVGTAVGVTLAVGWTVAVPDLAGVGAAEAQERLAQAGADLMARLGRPPQPPALTLGARRQVEDERAPGSVIAQRPPAGTRAALHQAVDVELAVTPTVTVPALIGRARSSKPSRPCSNASS